MGALNVVCAECVRRDSDAPTLAVFGTFKGVPWLLIRGTRRGRDHFGARPFALPPRVRPLADDPEEVFALLLPAPEPAVAEVLGSSLDEDEDGSVRATRWVWHRLVDGLDVELVCPHRHRLVLSVVRVTELAVQAVLQGAELVPIQPEPTAAETLTFSAGRAAPRS